MRRLLCLDVLRGFFILMVILLHAFGHVLFWNAQIISREEVSIWVLVLFAPLLLLSTWAPVFALISGFANAYVLHGLMARHDARFRGTSPLNGHVRGIMLNSLCLFGVSLIHVGLLHFRLNFNGQEHFTLLTGSLERGILGGGSLNLLFFNDAIELIAMSGLVIGCVLWLLWRNGGFEQRRRNYIALTGLALAWLALTPLLHKYLDGYYFQAIDEARYSVAIPLKFIVGPAHSTFPNVAFALIGAVLGMAVSERAPIRNIRRFGYGFGAASLVAALGLLVGSGFSLGPELVGRTLPMPVFLANLGLMLMLITLLIDRIEYRPDAVRAKIAARTTFLRRFSLLAMTVYTCESLLCVINVKWYLPLWPEAGLAVRYLQVFAYAGMQVALWYGIARVWEQWEFKYSFEWIVVRIAGFLRGRVSSRLKVQEVLYHPVELQEVKEAA